MRLFSYIITYDAGVAPNPFWGYCTLACCKPKIRRTAKPEDWIVGLSPKDEGNKVVYAMKVDEVLPFAEYFRDHRFVKKRPDMHSQKEKIRRGDNFYECLSGEEYRQHESMHSKGPIENPEHKNTDLSGKNVLISKNFYYFGSDAKPLLKELDFLKVGRGHKNNFTEDQIKIFLNFIEEHKPGVDARPAKWKENDSSWKKGCS
jgi:hypothetical protein